MLDLAAQLRVRKLQVRDSSGQSPTTGREERERTHDDVRVDSAAICLPRAPGRDEEVEGTLALPRQEGPPPVAEACGGGRRAPATISVLRALETAEPPAVDPVEPTQDRVVGRRRRGVGDARVARRRSLRRLHAHCRKERDERAQKAKGEKAKASSASSDLRVRPRRFRSSAPFEVRPAAPVELAVAIETAPPSRARRAAPRSSLRTSEVDLGRPTASRLRREARAPTLSRSTLASLDAHEYGTAAETL